MGMDLFRKIVDEAATIPEIDDYTITGLGETLLDPHLDERIAYVRDKATPKTLAVFTNGTYLTPERFDRLQSAGLKQLIVSLNAHNAETRRRVMGLDDWDRVLVGVKYALAHESTCRVRISAVVSDESMAVKDSEALFLAFAKPGDRFHDRFSFVAEGNWTGDTKTLRDFKPNECCERAISMIYVTFDGKVTPCCFDPLGKMTFGDLNHQGLREIYNTERYVNFRVDHWKDKADKYDICRECTRI